MKSIKLIALFLLIILSQKLMSQIHTETIEYKDGDVILEGYIAYDESIKDKRPGVIVVHQWMGLTDYEKMRCEMLAKLGYFAFAADIYGKGVRPNDMKSAGEQAMKYKKDRVLLRSRVNAALIEMKKQELVNINKLGAIGYCFGGTTVLELARSGAEVKGIVSFHGTLETPNPEDAKNIKAKILVCNGGADPAVPKEKIEAFEKEMKDAGVDYQIISYEGAVHSFTIPTAGSDTSKGSAYNEKADKASWEDMKKFFSEIFQ
jgi:dienelactone hydrolase